jgi:hypothetical protein
MRSADLSADGGHTEQGTCGSQDAVRTRLHPLKVATRVRIPLGVPQIRRSEALPGGLHQVFGRACQSLATPSTARPAPSCWPVARPRSLPSASCSRPWRPTGTSRSPTPTGSRCPTLHTQPSSGTTCRPVRLRAMRSSPPSAGRTSSRARGCGRPAKPRRCSASAATCSSIEGCPGAHASVRGYWKHGRSADAEDDA